MLSRLMGQETEYAIRFSTERVSPGNDVIYEKIAQAIQEELVAEPGMYSEKPQLFLENGGAVNYEYFPYRSEGGLLEAATPECRGPSQLLLYQRAQEALLRKVLRPAEAKLRHAGFVGKLGLLKNCRDAEGHVYGAQESYEVDLAGPVTLGLYRLALAALIPLLVLTVVLTWGLVIALLVLAVPLWVVLSVTLGGSILERFFGRDDRTFENRLGRFLYWLSYLVSWPFLGPFAILLKALAFRKMRRELTPFLVTRPIFSGCGTVEEGGVLRLSEKGPAVRALMRGSVRPEDRGIFDPANLMKAAIILVYFHWRPVVGLFARRQRMQLGLADSNVLEEAEFLKMGATALVVDMVEAGALRDVPRMWRPVRALHTVIDDPSLRAEVATRRGKMTALEIQRYYLEEAKRFVRESPTKSMEAEDVLRLWEDVLGRLEKGRLDSLVGRLDWVTKRYLLESCGGPGTDARLKTIDLRYHELGEGYGARLLERGFARRLLDRADVARAARTPPEGTPAFLRGRFIREQGYGLVPIRISWDTARIGGRLGGKVVRFPGSDPGPSEQRIR